MLCKLAKIKDLFLFTRPFDLTGSVKKTIRNSLKEHATSVEINESLTSDWISVVKLA
jgi:hypothetical protein